MVCDDIIPGNAKMVIDKEDQLSAAVDIFLDIAMFNSYSFLNEMPHEEKVMFINMSGNACIRCCRLWHWY